MIKCFSYFNDRVKIFIHICFEDGILWSIGVGQGKEIVIDPFNTYTIDSEIYCNEDSNALFNDVCFNVALDVIADLLKRFDFEVYEEIAED
jgi:hypothetical protein